MQTDQINELLKSTIERTGIGVVIDVKENDGTSFTVKTGMTDKQVLDLRSANYDIEAHVISIFVNELIVASMKELLKHTTDAEETFNLDKTFVMCSGRIATILMDRENFVSPLVKNHELSVSSLYFCGKIDNTSVIVNPYISYSQTHSVLFDCTQPVDIFVTETKMSENLYSITAKIKVVEKLKCYVYNFPPDSLFI